MALSETEVKAFKEALPGPYAAHIIDQSHDVILSVLVRTYLQCPNLRTEVALAFGMRMAELR